MKNIILGKVSLLCVIILSLSVCLQVDTEWHRFNNRQPMIEKDYEDYFKLLTDGWKIIGKSEKMGILDWGWEATIAYVKKGEERLVLIDPITKLEFGFGNNGFECVVEYVLIDEDGF